jgi:hypothetical protein
MSDRGPFLASLQDMTKATAVSFERTRFCFLIGSVALTLASSVASAQGGQPGADQADMIRSTDVVQYGGAQPGVPSTASRSVATFNLPDHQECGQDCLYSKANENLSLQVSYVRTTMVKLNAVQGSNNVEIANILGNFCTPDEIQSTSGTPAAGSSTLDDCKNRFLRRGLFVLSKQASAIEKNDIAGSLLSSRAPGAQGLTNNTGATGFERYREPGADPLKPQVPYVPTYEDLQKEYVQKHQDARYYASEEYNNYIKSAAAVPSPSPDDFIQVKAIQKTPGVPNSGFYYQPVLVNGKPQYDAAAYAKALDTYKLYKDALKKDQGEIDQSIQIEKKVPSRALEATKDPTVQLGHAVKQRDVFVDSRMPVVKAGNDAVLKSGLIQASGTSPTNAAGFRNPANQGGKQSTALSQAPQPKVPGIFSSMEVGLKQTQPGTPPQQAEDVVVVPPARTDQSAFVTEGYKPDTIRTEIDRLKQDVPTN